MTDPLNRLMRHMKTSGKLALAVSLVFFSASVLASPSDWASWRIFFTAGFAFTLLVSVAQRIHILRLKRHLYDTEENNERLALQVTERAESAARRAAKLAVSEETLKNKENILRAVLDSMADGVLVLGATGKPFLWNPAAEKILGARVPEAPVGSWGSHFGFYLADRKTPYPESRLPLERVRLGESVKDQEIVMRRSGREAWLSVSARPLVVLSGKEAFEGGVFLFRDITDRKRADQAIAAMHMELEQNEEKFRTLITNMPGAVYRSEAAPHRPIRFVTEVVREITGYQPEEFITGRDFMSLVHPDDNERVRKAWDQALWERSRFAMEYRLIRSDGTVRWVSDKAQPIFGHDPDGVWVDGVLFDITDRKLAEAALIQKTSELAHSNAEREQLELFAFIASHDLKEPLQRILGLNDLIKACGEPLSGDRLGYLAKIQQTVLRMGQLIDDLLRFTRAVTKSEVFEEVDLDAVVRGVLENLEFAIKKSEARIEMDKLPSVRADRLQMSQLFQNLIGNALKFAKKGEKPYVQIRAGGIAGGFQEIFVKDDGVGFDEKYLDKIFKPFERLQLKHEVEGSGVGLAICDKIMKRHGGSIWATSLRGEGSTFTIRIPLALSEIKAGR